MDCSNGPFGWRETLRPYYLYALYLSIVVTQIPCSMVMLLRGYLLQGILILAGLSVSLLGRTA